MRVLLDENLDRRLKRHFDVDFEVVTVGEQGWSGKKNGELLRAAPGMRGGGIGAQGFVYFAYECSRNRSRHH